VPPAPKSARAQISEVVNQGVTKRRIKGLLDDAFAAETLVVAECPGCGNRMKVRAPDVKKQLDVVIGLLEQAEGRPEQRAPGDLVVVVERPAR